MSTAGRFLQRARVAARRARGQGRICCHYARVSLAASHCRHHRLRHSTPSDNGENGWKPKKGGGTVGTPTTALLAPGRPRRSEWSRCRPRARGAMIGPPTPTRPIRMVRITALSSLRWETREIFPLSERDVLFLNRQPSPRDRVCGNGIPLASLAAFIARALRPSRVNSPP
ncbi:MAG: hypothetical protein GWP17_02145 [Aquificales bacterium]|nr:hypothetical protein [Aquificales bacterium]